MKDTYLEVLYNKGMYKPLTLDEAVDICKDIYKMFIKNDIYVLRIGLQVSEDFTLGKNVVAGPFHPAFRELVESSLLNEFVLYTLNTLFKDKTDINIFVNQKTLSKLYSNKKKFFIDMIKQIPSKNIKIKQNAELDVFEFMFKSDGICLKVSLIDYIKQ